MSLNLLAITDLSQRCSQESDRFFSRQDYDPSYCFELFRRAIFHRNEYAWELLYRQYERLVLHWVERNPLVAAADEDSVYFANRAFEKMWRGLTPEKFADFADLKSVLRYLQMCTHSVIVDYMRHKEQMVLQAQVDEPDITGMEGSGTAVERTILTHERRADFWRWLNQQLADDQEYKVIHSSFVLDLKPREIAEQFPESFTDVREIYRIKEKVMSRLRSQAELADFMGDV
jgi:RNA polymerase sigma factor (sigma-70 family)